MIHLIKNMLFRKKTYLFLAIVLALFNFILIRNYALFQDGYSLNSIVSELPEGIKLLILIRGYNLDSFNDYYRYCVKGIAIIIYIYAFAKGIDATKSSNYELKIIRISRTKNYLYNLLEFTLKLLIVLLPSLLVAMLSALVYSKNGYLTILYSFIIILIISLFFYSLATISNGRIRIILWISYGILSIILAYVACRLKYLGFISIIEMFQYKYFMFAILGYLIISIPITLIGIFKYRNLDFK